jgi:hypothetical protein
MSMSQSYTFSDSESFTVTHAKKLASKVATDLKRMQRFYNAPSDEQISIYEQELVVFLKGGYLGEVTYGFKKDGKWVEPTLRYTAKNLNEISGIDDDPGRILPGANTNGATFFSFLTYANSWEDLSSSERDLFAKTLPFIRGTGSEPSINGALVRDLSYSSGGKVLERSLVRGYK